MSFSDFHGDLKICISVNRMELTIKYRKTVMQKLYLTHKHKPEILKNGKNLDKEP